MQQVWEWWSTDEQLQQAARDMTAAGVKEHWRLLQEGVLEIASTILNETGVERRVGP